MVLFEKMLDHFIVNMIAAISHLHLSQETDVAKTIAKEKQQRQMEETRLDPAFERYNTGAVIQTKLKSFQSYIKPEERDPSNPESWGKISRNELGIAGQYINIPITFRIEVLHRSINTLC